MNFSFCHERLCTLHCSIYWCHFCKFTLYVYDLSSITSTIVQIRPLFVYITFLYKLINVFIYLVTDRPIGPVALCVFVYVIVYSYVNVYNYVNVYTYVNVCTSHNNKPFTYNFTYRTLKINVQKLPLSYRYKSTNTVKSSLCNIV